MSEWIEIPPHRVLKILRSDFVGYFDVVYAASGAREAASPQSLNAVYPHQIAFYVRNSDGRRFKRPRHRPFEDGVYVFLEEF